MVWMHALKWDGRVDQGSRAYPWKCRRRQAGYKGLHRSALPASTTPQILNKARRNGKQRAPPPLNALALRRALLPIGTPHVTPNTKSTVTTQTKAPPNPKQTPQSKRNSSTLTPFSLFSHTVLRNHNPQKHQTHTPNGLAPTTTPPQQPRTPHARPHTTLPAHKRRRKMRPGNHHKTNRFPHR